MVSVKAIVVFLKVKLNLLDRKPWRSVAIPEESGIPRSTFTIGLCCDSKARLDDFCTWKNGKKYGETVDCGKLEVIHGLCQSFNILNLKILTQII